MFRAAFVLLVLTIALGLQPVVAATWNVEADGSGDFSVIQDAVEAASDGDIIVIGPGRFSQYINHAGNPIYVNIIDKQLTLKGAGPDVTFIGPEDPYFHPRPGPFVVLINT